MKIENTLNPTTFALAPLGGSRLPPLFVTSRWLQTSSLSVAPNFLSPSPEIIPISRSPNRNPAVQNNHLLKDIRSESKRKPKVFAPAAANILSRNGETPLDQGWEFRGQRSAKP